MGHLDFARYHRLNHPRTAADANDLDIQTLPFESFGPLGDERGGLRAAELQMDEAKLFELLLRARARCEAQSGANKKRREWLSGFHFRFFRLLCGEPGTINLISFTTKIPARQSRNQRSKANFHHEGTKDTKLRSLEISISETFVTFVTFVVNTPPH
jgi:hypothetical protein